MERVTFACKEFEPVSVPLDFLLVKGEFTLYPEAERYFDQALASSRDQRAGVLVAKAEAIAQPAGDRAAFEALLRQALQASADRRDLSNVVMRERAQWLLDTADDLF